MPHTITMTKKTFEPTDSGKGWKSKPLRVETTQLTEEQYNNVVSPETRRFFKRLGGSESIVKGYTCAGYKAISCTSCNSDRTARHVREFDFVWNEVTK